MLLRASLKVDKKSGGLNSSKDHFAKLGRVDRATPDPVGGVAAVAVPSLKVKTSVILVILLVPDNEKPDQFVSKNGQPPWVFPSSARWPSRSSCRL